MNKQVPTYTTTEELVMRQFDNGEIPYRCMRVEVWFPNEPYSREVGYVRLPYKMFSKVREIIERAVYED